MPPRRKSQPRSPEHAALGEAIRQLRIQEGLSQEDLSDASEVHLTNVGALERGRQNPSYTTLLRLAEALNTRVGQLTTLADQLRDKSR